MKTIIASAIVALSFAAPAVADTSNAAAFFALGNDSAAERVLGATSSGDAIGTAQALALTNTSPAENTVTFERARNVDSAAVRAAFALSNDSAAERIAN